MSHTFDFAMSELTALHVVYAVSQPVLLQLHRLALRMQEMPPQTQHTSPVPPPLLQLKPPPSPPIPTSTIASYWSPCPISSASHLTQLINHTLMPLKILQVFPMTLGIRGQTPSVAVAFQSRSPVQLFATSWTAAH